jgi:hypothetical protein
MSKERKVEEGKRQTTDDRRQMTEDGKIGR